MYKSAIIISGFTFALLACVEPVKYNVCISQSDEGFIAPLSDELSHQGIEHQIRGNQLCYKSIDKERVSRARSLVSSFRNSVATVLRDEATERRIVEWLLMEKKSYEITKTTDGDRFLMVHSESKGDSELNRKKLISIERGS
ncbi:hypothetical protein [Solemya pervernicosa gill symbiont]|uniref:hypothetical protein n=1 Tax=Solemya pervernicosa gill symbiont TaxID=642797 RepID=UPI00099703FD|nr:hypothetical protein [Solemya pervernicosa gill symbiont]